jgi:uncharacterized BrkB/YihY/UPF0761 family membrane protein
VETILSQAESIRSTNRSVNVAFVAYESDRRAGGSLMAAAIAYRLFLWTLPLALVVIGALAFLSSTSISTPSESVRDVGITSIPAHSINQAFHDSGSAWWLALLVGGVLLYLASVGLLKALWVAHAILWRDQPARIPSKPRAVGLLLLICLIVAVATSAAAIIRVHTGSGGLVAMLADILVYGGAWWALSTQLPHDGANLAALIPGAVVLGIGTQAMHLIVVYYLGRRLSSASALYGTLGTAAALLLGLYLVGRLMILSSELNQAVWTGYFAAPSPATEDDQDFVSPVGDGGGEWIEQQLPE